MSYWRQKLVQGLFLSSGVVKDPDTTMELLLQTARILREKEGFGGYLHLKVIPGASKAAVEEAARLADALSLNLEAPKKQYFTLLSQRKRFEDLITLSRYLAQLKESFKFSHTTQLVVGAAGESDEDLIRITEALYHKLGLNRVYFSAYQPGCGRPELPGETLARRLDLRTREHRLYQVDFLLRRYGFKAQEIPLVNGFLDLEIDPKTAWARAHPEFFPVNVNRASYEELLRVPGIGPTLAKRILKLRRERRLRDLSGLGPESFISRARPYVSY
jgi:predicted DNA-binding helix-hairpin-helix protein